MNLRVMAFSAIFVQVAVINEILNVEYFLVKVLKVSIMSLIATLL